MGDTGDAIKKGGAELGDASSTAMLRHDDKFRAAERINLPS
jgi:hypothetical protein